MGRRTPLPRTSPRPALLAVAVLVAAASTGGTASGQETAATSTTTVATPATPGSTAAAAAAPGAGGGTAAPGNPRISGVGCLSRCIGPASGVVRSRVKITGSDLGNTVLVSFPGRRGKRARDRSPVVKPSGAVLAKVPRKATSGPVRVADSFGQFNDSGTIFIVGTKAQLRAARLGFHFPVRGLHSFGGPESRFGAPRGDHVHQGQDVSAACGTVLAAVHSGVVKATGFQASGAGHYVVIDGADVEQDYVYFHLLNPAPLAIGQTVSTGQRVGKVGSTGSSTGCHLHFELWVGPGWFTGGWPIDPLPLLQYWDSYS
jgi:murein DD-endopeptidase MepM/ murein hydrolase activator NlpD